MSLPWHVSQYETLVFDCDGVVLDSNRVKTQAFYEAALPYGEAAANRLVEYHVNHGGISRYKKFALFLEEMVDGRQGPGLDFLLDAYATRVREGLMSCEIAPGLEALRQMTRESRWLIVSGGDETEIREVFAARRISGYFDGGIYGSPDTKDELLARELDRKNISDTALFLGDSTYDHRASSEAGLDFIFISGWSEVPDWNLWCAGNNIPHVEDIQKLV